MTIYLMVLHDSVLDEQIPVGRTKLGILGSGNVTFRDLQRRPLLLPSLVFPYRRALCRHARAAYLLALEDPAPQVVAQQTYPSESEWDNIFSYVKSQSPECSDTLETLSR